MILSVDYSESKFFLFERNEFLDVVFVRRTYIYIYIYIEMDWTDWSQFISLKLVLFEGYCLNGKEGFLSL